MLVNPYQYWHPKTKYKSPATDWKAVIWCFLGINSIFIIGPAWDWFIHG